MKTHIQWSASLSSWSQRICRWCGFDFLIFIPCSTTSLPFHSWRFVTILPFPPAQEVRRVHHCVLGFSLELMILFFHSYWRAPPPQPPPGTFQDSDRNWRKKKRFLGSVLCQLPLFFLLPRCRFCTWSPCLVEGQEISLICYFHNWPG